MPVALERRISIVAIVAAAAALIAHASSSIGSSHLNVVSGIWLALGRDLEQGVFYRDLLGELGYGGTRYFPLFFAIIALFMRAGAGPLTAGWLAAGVTAVVLAAGMYRLVRALGGTRLTASVFGAAAVTPYFVQQTLFEMRADVLAAALNIWGLAFLADAYGRHSPRSALLWTAALFFTLATAAKVTSIAIAGAVVAAMLAAGCRTLAVGVGWRFAVTTALAFAVVQWASSGRALESWRACMFAGSDAGGTLGFVLGGGFLRMISYSRLLQALLIIVVASLVAAWLIDRRAQPHAERRSLWLPATVCLGSSASTVVALSSPGTVASNHMVEWIEVALFVLAFLVCTHPRMMRPLLMVVSALMIWMSAQDVARAREIWKLRRDALAVHERSQLVSRVASAPGLVLAESALWPVLAGRQPYLLDPFALRVVMQSRKDIELDLSEKLEKRTFSMVILQIDPTSLAGRGYYEHVSFGWAITQQVLKHYRFESHPLSDVYVYVPR